MLPSRSSSPTTEPLGNWKFNELVVVLFAASIFLISIISPPALMDDMDSTQAQIARTMLQSGDWVTPRLDGVAYLEKAPLKYWLIAICYQVFGVHDWAARIPMAVCVILLCWLTARVARWGINPAAGFYAGIVLSTCIGLFLFTRVLITDAMLTLPITFAIWAAMRAMDKDEANPRLWAVGFWAAMAAAILFKGLIGAVFPAGALFIYALIRREMPRKLWSWPGCSFSRWPCRGMSWPHYGILRISTSPCTPSREPIEASSGSTSSTNTFFAF
jgi:4-amino-4-deoxy-L-arabinose transferase-like glycosyltransferase